MADYEISLALLAQVLENRTFLGEALFFPEFSCFRDRPARLAADVRRLAARALKGVPAAELHSRHVPGQPEVGELSLVIDPPRRKADWIDPVTLSFGVVRWAHSSAGPLLAYVPALGIEVIATNPDERERLLESESRAALMQQQALGSLRELVWLQRAGRLRLVPVRCKASRLRLKEAAIAERERLKRGKSVLREVATDLTHERLTRAYERDALVALLAETLGGRQPKSILLVGPSGVGKTAAVDELVRQRQKLGFGARPFWRTSGSRLIAGMWGFGMWEERARAVCREAAQTRAILHVGNLIELMEVGKSSASALGIAGFLRPSLARGEVLAIAECTPEELALVARVAPPLVDAFCQIVVREPAGQERLQILERTCADFRPSRGGTQPAGPSLSTDALDAVDRLHRRYATYSAFPGRPVRFLNNLLRDGLVVAPPQERGAASKRPGSLFSGRNAASAMGPAPESQAPAPAGSRTSGGSTTNAREPESTQPASRLQPGRQALGVTDVLAAFSRETGLPRFLLDPSVPFDPGATRNWFAARVVGQPLVIDLIVDLLATVKAGLARPRKPLASLMFIGPTGVGKTEMSKTLAEFLFGSPERLTRFDMSEFADAVAVSRLIGGIFGAEGLLTAKVREQPFSVLLFDEVEKAAPEFFDLLLQVLGEGRLTDAGGRLADFCNAVVVMTSNLGAEAFRQGNVGFGDAGKEAAGHFEAAVRSFVRPELYGRVDRIVPFAPLDEASILKIAGGQLERLRERDGIKYRGVELRMPPEVARHLAARGFDTRYGARPLKRRIERDLLAPLAEQLNGYALQQPLEAEVSLAAGELQITVRARNDTRGEAPVAGHFDATACRSAQKAVDLRRNQQRLENCQVVVDLQNELYRLTDWERRLVRRVAKSRDAARMFGRPEIAAGMSRLAALRGMVAEIQELGQNVVALEESSLCAFYGDAVGTAREAADYETTSGLWELLLLKLHAWRFPNPDQVLLAIYSEDAGALIELAAAYFAAATRLQMTADLYQYLAVQGARTDVPIILTEDAPPALWRRPVEEPEEFFELRPAGAIGLALVLRGPGALLRFGPESGLHEFIDPERPKLCLVESGEQAIGEYKPPAGIKRRGTIAGPQRRRVYDRRTNEIVDNPLSARLEWFGRDLADVLVDVTERRLNRDAYAMLEES